MLTMIVFFSLNCHFNSFVQVFHHFRHSPIYHLIIHVQMALLVFNGPSGSRSFPNWFYLIVATNEMLKYMLFFHVCPQFSLATFVRRVFGKL